MTADRPTATPEDQQVDERLVARRAEELTTDEKAAGSDRPEAQARAILEDSEARAADRNAAPGSVVEQRRSEDTVEPLD
jgi:hypothetical protein